MIIIDRINFTYGRHGGSTAAKKEHLKTESTIVISAKGLTTESVTEMRKKHGSNILSRRKPKSFLSHFISNFNDPIIKILLGALVLNIIFSFRHSNWPETIGVAIAILIATLVSTVSEFSSCRAAEKLSADDDSLYSVKRNGKFQPVSISDIVAGDVIMLERGMKIPADGILISGKLSCNQAALTGEGKDVKKRGTTSIAGIQNYISGTDKMTTSGENFVFRGSSVTSGNGEFIVIRTGDNTMYGKVAADLGEDSPESPLKHRLGVLAAEISFIGYIAAALVAISYLFNVFVIDSGMDMTLALTKMKDLPYLFHEILSALTLAVSVLVVAVPEGLPMMITVVLSSNMKKMLHHGVLVKRMVGIETAGSMNILFTDKTGTLTEGKMTVKSIISADGGYSTLHQLKRHTALYSAFSTASFAVPVPGSHNTADIAVSEFFNIKEFADTVTLRIPFESENRFAAAFFDGITYVRGATEIILDASCYYLSESGDVLDMTPEIKSVLFSKMLAAAETGARIIASAYVTGNHIKNISNTSMPNLVFCGMICLEDKLRSDARKSVLEAKAAGIKVVMMTGDNITTAGAVARECGILDKDSIILEGEELSALSDTEISEMLPKISVIARALPSDKLRIIKIARQNGYISGMTGDGINDAPSLKAADVGFSMGSGTDVTKEAGDIVITNNSFSSIVRAVLYGRTIFRSIRKFIVFQLTMNLSATVISFIGPFIGVESPVTIIQMLWVNIIMDTLGALAFAGESTRKRYMDSPPFPPDTKILTGEMIRGILLNGLFIISMSIFFLKSKFCGNMFSAYNKTYFLTAFFSFFIFSGIALSFNSRTPKVFCLAEIGENKPFIIIMLLVAFVQLLLVYFGGEVFRCTPISFTDLAKTAVMSLMILPFGSIIKLSMKNRKSDL